MKFANYLILCHMILRAKLVQFSIRLRTRVLFWRLRSFVAHLRAMPPDDAMRFIVAMRWKLGQNHEILPAFAQSFDRMLGRLAEEISAKRQQDKAI